MSAHELLSKVELAGPERKALAARAVHAADFVICRNRIRISGNTPRPVEAFKRFYGPFLSGAAGAQPDLALACGETEDAAGRSVTLAIGDEAFRVRDPGVIENLDTAIEYLILQRIRSHFLVHAGCVARAGRGLVIAGASGMGKTTLTAHLVARGMGYLSDEAAPIHRKDGTVEPFPFRLGIRPGPADDLARGLPAIDFRHGDERKRLVDASALGAPPVAGPVPLHAVVFLAQRATPAVSTPFKFDGPVVASFLGVTPEFREDLLGATGAVIEKESRPFPKIISWRLKVPRPSSFLPTLYTVAARHEIPVVGVAHEDLEPKDFTASPRVVKLPQAAGVMELIKKMSSLQLKAILRSDFEGKMPLLVEELVRLTADAAFYKLTPGRLDEMLAALEGLS